MTGRLKHLLYVALFLGAMWAIFWYEPEVSNVLTAFAYWILDHFSGEFSDSFGLVPKDRSSAVGIVSATFIHGDPGHLWSNLVTLALFLVLLVLTCPRPWIVVVILIVVEGALLWIMGEAGSGPHIGASGLLFALGGFLLARGVVVPSLATLAAACIVMFDLAPGLAINVTPAAGEGISWESHLFGFLAGGALGLVWRERGRATLLSG